MITNQNISEDKITEKQKPENTGGIQYDDGVIVGPVKKVNSLGDPEIEEINKILRKSAGFVKQINDLYFSELICIFGGGTDKKYNLRPIGAILPNIKRYEGKVNEGITPLTTISVTKASLNGHTVETFMRLYEKVKGRDTDVEVKAAQDIYQEKEETYLKIIGEFESKGVLYQKDIDELVIAKSELEDAKIKLSSELNSVKVTAEADKKNLEARLNDTETRLKDSKAELIISEGKYQNALSARKIVRYEEDGKVIIVENGKEIEYTRTDSIPTVANGTDENALSPGKSFKDEIDKINNIYKEYIKLTEADKANGFDAQTVELAAKIEESDELNKSLLKMAAGKDEEAKNMNLENEKLVTRYVQLKHAYKKMGNIFLGLIETIRYVDKTVGLQQENEEKLSKLLENKSSIIEQKEGHIGDLVSYVTEMKKRIRDLGINYVWALEENRQIRKENSELITYNKEANLVIGEKDYQISTVNAEKEKLEQRIRTRLLPLINRYKDQTIQMTLISDGKDRKLAVMSGKNESTLENYEDAMDLIDKATQIYDKGLNASENQISIIKNQQKAVEELKQRVEEKTIIVKEIVKKLYR